MTRPLLLLVSVSTGLVLPGQLTRAHAQDTLQVARLQEAALRSDPRAGQIDLLRSATDLRLAASPTLEAGGARSRAAGRGVGQWFV